MNTVFSLWHATVTVSVEVSLIFFNNAYCLPEFDPTNVDVVVHCDVKNITSILSVICASLWKLKNKKKLEYSMKYFLDAIRETR